MTKKNWIILTTIHPPNDVVRDIVKRCGKEWTILVVGDTKTPASWRDMDVVFLDVQDQHAKLGPISKLIPTSHYCRKNLGYLFAIEQGAEVILDVDNDGHPYDGFGENIDKMVTGRTLQSTGWINVHKHFTKQFPVWPRGLPLDMIHQSGETIPASSPIYCPIQNFLVDIDPDVDSIFRLVFKEEVAFEKTASPLILGRGTHSPFNSQNTLFFKEAFPLLYLPCHVSWRVTDIWRSFVAQKALYAEGYCWAVHAPTLKQIRNPHDLMVDFNQEVPGYLNNRKFMECLDQYEKEANMIATAKSYWNAVVKGGFIESKESPIIESWFERFKA